VCDYRGNIGVENLGKKIAAIIGMIGGIVVLVGVYLDWIMGSVLTANGFDFLMVGENGLKLGRGIVAEVVGWGEAQAIVILVLIGGILALAGGVLALVSIIFRKSAKLKFLSYLMLIGGILSIVGAGWGYVKVGRATRIAMTGVPGLGLYIIVIGGLIALKWAFDLKAEE
jgi:hypothetical protein